jgi:hypothetical protein
MTFQRQTDKNPFQFHIIFRGMNPLKENSHNRTKGNIREIRHVHLDLDEGFATCDPLVRFTPSAV